MNPNSNSKWEPSTRDANHMLHVYIHDFLSKRNLKQTASCFLQETQVNPATVAPENIPVNAPQGFLFEWWAVFWDEYISQHKQLSGDSAAGSQVSQQQTGQLQNPSHHGQMLGPDRAMMKSLNPVGGNPAFPGARPTGDDGAMSSSGSGPMHHAPQLRMSVGTEENIMVSSGLSAVGGILGSHSATKPSPGYDKPGPKSGPGGSDQQKPQGLALRNLNGQRKTGPDSESPSPQMPSSPLLEDQQGNQNVKIMYGDRMQPGPGQSQLLAASPSPAIYDSSLSPQSPGILAAAGMPRGMSQAGSAGQNLVFTTATNQQGHKVFVSQRPGAPPTYGIYQGQGQMQLPAGAVFVGPQGVQTVQGMQPSSPVPGSSSGSAPDGSVMVPANAQQYYRVSDIMGAMTRKPGEQMKSKPRGAPGGPPMPNQPQESFYVPAHAIPKPMGAPAAAPPGAQHPGGPIMYRLPAGSMPMAQGMRTVATYPVQNDGVQRPGGIVLAAHQPGMFVSKTTGQPVMAMVARPMLRNPKDGTLVPVPPGSVPGQPGTVEMAVPMGHMQPMSPVLDSASPAQLQSSGGSAHYPINDMAKQQQQQQNQMLMNKLAAQRNQQASQQQQMQQQQLHQHQQMQMQLHQHLQQQQAQANQQQQQQQQQQQLANLEMSSGGTGLDEDSGPSKGHPDEAVTKMKGMLQHRQGSINRKRKSPTATPSHGASSDLNSPLDPSTSTTPQLNPATPQQATPTSQPSQHGQSSSASESAAPPAPADSPRLAQDPANPHAGSVSASSQPAQASQSAAQSASKSSALAPATDGSPSFVGHRPILGGPVHPHDKSDMVGDESFIESVEDFFSTGDNAQNDDAVVVQESSPSSPGFSFREVACFTAHNSKANCCSFSADGRLLASAGADRKAHTWDVESMQLSHTLEGHTGMITDVRFSPLQSLLASASYDKTVRIWNCDESNGGSGDSCVAQLLGHNAFVTSADFHPLDANIVCSSDSEGDIKLWSVQDGVCSLTMEGAGKKQARFQPVHGQLLAAASDSVVNVFDINSQERVVTLTGHGKPVHSLCWNDTGDLLVTTSEDSVRVWSMTSNAGRCLQAFSSTGNRLQCCTFHPAYQSLIVIGSWKVIEVWHYAENRTIAVVDAHENLVAGLAHCPVTGLTASASHDSLVKLWK